MRQQLRNSNILPFQNIQRTLFHIFFIDMLEADDLKKKH